MLHLAHCSPLYLLTLSFSLCYAMNWVSTRRPKRGRQGKRGKLINPGREVRRGRLDEEKK